MVLNSRIIAIIMSAAIIIVGVIHLGVGIGIVAKHRGLSDIFQQQRSLSGYNIFLGLCAIGVGIGGLISILYVLPLFRKIMIVAAFVLGVFTLASFIAALAISSSTVGNIKETLTDNMNDYQEDDDAHDEVDNVQQKYGCCGVNLWLDWAGTSFGATSQVGRRRRRGHSYPLLSAMAQTARQKRQFVASNPTYNLPSTYSLPLPLSCCRNGGTTTGNTLTGTCAYQGTDSLSGFYIEGCLAPVANIATAETAGIAVINTCLLILSFVYGAELINIYPRKPKSNAANNNKQQESYQTNQGQDPYQINQEQNPQYQYQYGQYYSPNNDPSAYYNFDAPINRIYL